MLVEYQANRMSNFSTIASTASGLNNGAAALLGPLHAPRYQGNQCTSKGKAEVVEESEVPTQPDNADADVLHEARSIDSCGREPNTIRAASIWPREEFLPASEACCSLAHRT